jgi:tRNA 2-(methylsulfanyl)-N6-isopentenyladenosine37 hydroxylase
VTKTLPEDSRAMSELSAINNFLLCPTPVAWVDWALKNETLLLIDHANCEKKAAASAMNLMYRYVDKPDLLKKMSQLAREELLHFEQVVALMQDKSIHYHHLSSSRYASSMRTEIRTHEPARLIDTLIIGAFVEARSCERFAALVPYLDEQISRFYNSLLKSESRHFVDYLSLARQYNDEDIDQNVKGSTKGSTKKSTKGSSKGSSKESFEERINYFAKIEAELINSVDEEFRFHSGIPA